MNHADCSLYSCLSIDMAQGNGARPLEGKEVTVVSLQQISDT